MITETIYTDEALPQVRIAHSSKGIQVFINNELLDKHNGDAVSDYKGRAFAKGYFQAIKDIKMFNEKAKKPNNPKRKFKNLIT